MFGNKYDLNGNINFEKSLKNSPNAILYLHNDIGGTDVVIDMVDVVIDSNCQNILHVLFVIDKNNQIKNSVQSLMIVGSYPEGGSLFIDSDEKKAKAECGTEGEGECGTEGSC